MVGFPNEKTVERLRKEYPVGTRIELVNMNDPYSKLVPGDRGCVVNIDDAGTAHIRWDSGSGLGLVYGKDSYRKLTEKEMAEEQINLKENIAENEKDDEDEIEM